jgi:hypothetical protein
MGTVLNLLQSGAPAAVARLMRLIEMTMENILIMQRSYMILN